MKTDRGHMFVESCPRERLPQQITRRRINNTMVGKPWTFWDWPGVETS